MKLFLGFFLNIEQLKIAHQIFEGAPGEVQADPKEGVHRSAISSAPQDSPRNLRRYSLRKVPRGPREGAKEDTKEGVASGTLHKKVAVSGYIY